MAKRPYPRPDNYPILSCPIEQMKAEYDVVVVGSGYGAGVAASRLARAGKSVAVLELGWERRPGSFPHTLRQCLRDLAISGTRETHGILGRLPLSGKTKLFQLKLGDGQHSFCAHGLGGGSLINAGVFLEATPSTFERSPWPAEIRQDAESMKQYYDRAANILQPSPYPDNRPTPTKLNHLYDQAKLLGNENTFSRVPLTTFFSSGHNSSGVAMSRNEGSGHEATGLNDGSKNTVPVTYLADAWNWGSEIFCGCEVLYIEKAQRGQGYIVHFIVHDTGRGIFDEARTQVFWVKANEFCFLGAGAMGTTEILLRSRRHGLSLSPLVGRNMSGNGDMLLFGYNLRKDVDGIAGGSTAPGPTITGMIDNRKTPLSDPLSGYVIQDGCIPEPFAPILQAMLATQTLKSDITSFIWHPHRQICRTLAALKPMIKGPYTQGGAMQRTATYLIMSHDSNEITLTLDGDKPLLQGGSEGRSRSMCRIADMMNRVVEQSGGKLGFSYFGRNKEEVSVHVLGGANMSRNGTGYEGVTNHIGQVFTGHGTHVHPGLVCCDASVIPTSLGVNPMATITALAERSLSIITKQAGYTLDLETGNGTLDLTSSAKVRPDQGRSVDAKVDEDRYESIGWRFTEVLGGHISTPFNGDFQTSETAGKRSLSSILMALTVHIQKRRRDSGPKYKGECTGTVSCRALSQRTMRVISGELDFFSPGGEDADSTQLIYRLRLLSVEGVKYNITGYKTVNASTAWSTLGMWRATTTVNLQIFTDEEDAVGAGVARVALSSFTRQMLSFRSARDISVGAIFTLLLFLFFFAAQISVFFFHPLIPRRRCSPTSPPYPPKSPPASTAKLKSSDGVEVSVEVYDPATSSGTDTGLLKCPILFLPGVTGVRPEHSIFALPYQRCNMVEYFSIRGHRCYVLTPRWGCRVASECTVFDIRLDVAAALQHISLHESQKPYVIAHCQGSVSLGMALLDGTVRADQLLGVTANSVFMNQVFAYWNAIKAWSPILIRVYELLDGRYFPIALGGRKSTFHHALDALLNFYPIPRRRDRCRSKACHRTSFAFGLLWNHENLNKATHDNIDRFFSGTPTRLLEHITRMGTRGGPLNSSNNNNNLDPLMTEANIERLRDLPIMFMSGVDNEVFDPETTLRDYELLRRRFGEHMYRRFLVEGYGHLDPIVGKNADRDVYWRVFEHVKWCAQHTMNGISRMEEM
ncbi:FAD/NAD(P)-binding domain-containing protein [Aspergillus heterothallicus]